ncbi:MAG: hypothetical protein KGL12_12430 [Rhodospirillales bacterium]|nr:hypothetical protein [Rhodospirillales bacterium]
MPGVIADLAEQGRAHLAANAPASARAALAAAVAGGDARAGTLLNLALAEQECGAHRTARRRMHRLALAHPEWEEPPLRLAESLRPRRPRLAARLYDAALSRAPTRSEALIARGVLHLQAGNASAAQLLLLRAAGLAPDHLQAWDALGRALLAGAAPGPARAAFHQAARLAPGDPGPALHAVQAAFAAGEAAAEHDRLRAAMAASPLDPVPVLAAARLCELQDAPEAIDLFEVAAALAPQAKLPAALLGAALARAARPAEAAEAFAQAHACDPEDARLANDYAAVLVRLYRHAEARALLQRALAASGPNRIVLTNLTTATVSLGLQEEALGHAEAALAADPTSPLAHRNHVNILPYHPDTTGAALTRALIACAAHLPRPPAPPDFPRPPVDAPDRPLRLGLLSGSLRTHPVGWLTIAAFEALDPARFHPIALAQTSGSDAIARRFRAVCREWHDISRLDDAALAARARALGLDLVIDLGGYGDSGRMTACAYRLAPVQIKWVGMQSHTTGLAEMDWLITDRWETPPELEGLYTERLLRLPDGYVCYSPPPYAGPVAALPAQSRGGGVTFGCFNNLAKVTPRVLAAWAEILCRLPDARLVLKTHAFTDPSSCARIRDAFAARGVAPARLDLRTGSPHPAFIAEYHEIDIALDPFPYSGGLTVCEALWMGVPTVALAGEFFAARHAASHLCNAGLADWVTDHVEDYIAMACRRAADIEALAALRAGLRARVAASPLCDAPRFARHLGAALQECWQAWARPALTDGQSSPASIAALAE